jgi:LemA protein
MSKSVGIIIVVLLVVAFFGFFITLFNRLVLLRYNVDKAWANIDVILKQRADEIPNIVKVVMQFVNHEEKMLNHLTELRTNFLNSTTLETKTSISNEISRSLKSVFAVTENYPNLLSNTNFLELQKRISELEDRIADRREFFNDSINLYNIGIHEFPNFILAKTLGYKNKSLLEVSSEEKKYNGIQF